MRFSRFVSIVLALGVFFPAVAGAQSTPPWTGIVANEARPSTPQQYGQGSNEMSSHAMSADGRFVVFDSNLSHLIPGDTNNWNDVFLRDRQTGELRRISVASNGAQANSYSAWGTISANGRYIAFNSCATNLVPDDVDTNCDLFIHDRVLGTTVRGNLGTNGELMDYSTQHSFRLSGDGRYFVFNASFDGAGWQVWLRDRDSDENGVFDEPGTSTTTQISHWNLGADQLNSFDQVAISNDGRWIAYTAETWVDGSNYIGTRVYVHDRVTNGTARVDRPMAGFTETPSYAGAPDFSDNNLLAYSSSENNLTDGDADGSDDIFVFNLLTGGNLPIELTHPGAPPIQYEWAPAISADGRYVAFMGASFGGWNFIYNIFAVDRQTGESYAISVRPDGSLDNTTGAPSISADGSSIAFSADPSMLVWGWGNTGIFVATGFDLSPADIDVPAQGGTFSVDVTVPQGIAWTLTPNGLDVSQTSGVGPATVNVTVSENTSNEEQDYIILLGSKQVELHQAIAPHVYYVDPWEGSLLGGTSITIYGERFADGATVTVGGVAATDVVVVSSGLIRATTPAHAAGVVGVTVTNPGGASASLDPAFVYRDTTPPVVTYEVTGTRVNGWYTSDVTVTFHYEDPESEVFNSGCASPFTLNWDEPYAFAICNVYSEGGQTVVDVDIKRDTVAPIVAIAPADPETYAQGQVVPIAHACNDATSGIASCTVNQAGPNLDTSTVGTFVYSANGVDQAGHSTTHSVSYTVKMPTDLTVPLVNSVYGNTTSLRATLIGSASPLAGKTIIFYVDSGVIGTAVTAANGEAILDLAPGSLNAGSYGMHAEFAGDDTAFPVMRPGALTIAKATPTLTWATPAFIVEGTALSGTQLNATSTVAGSLFYGPPAGTVLAAGTHTLAVAFAPQDPVNYEAATTTVTLKVKGVPVITWNTPPPIHIAEALTTTHLNATASVAGTFVYTPGLTWNWNVVGPQTISVTFTPTNTADYTSASASVVIEVIKGIPQINFPPSDSISYTAALSATQLNATAYMPGTFTYNPPAGTILPVGTHTLTATFTPNDLTRWEIVSATKSQVIYKADPAVNWNFPADISYGTPLGPAQQNATSNVAGTYEYFPPPGTILEIGQHWISVVLHPNDTANYNNGSSYASITVGLGQSSVSWSNPAAIVYPQSLGNTQLNATASLPGSFNYSPGFGTILSAGTHTLHVAFTPTDSSHYGGSSKDVTIVVGKRTPAITWNQPAGLTYGAALSASQLNATSNVAGTFAYSPAIGTVLPAGTHTLSVTFTPTDTANNFSATSTTSITVSAAAPVVSWTNPAGVSYGTPLSSTQLNATASVPGTFTYTPAAGTILNAGTQTLSVTFTPDDSNNYSGAGTSVSIAVAKAYPVVSWDGALAPIVYGTPLTSAQLYASTPTAGTITYNPPAGTVLDAGSRTITMTFTPDDPANYQTVTAQKTIAVSQQAANVTWNEPAQIVYGTALSAAQLNATAPQAGSYTYNPPIGTVLTAGPHTLSLSFAPNDPNYSGGNFTVTLLVVKRTPVITWSNPAPIVYGTALSNTQLNASVDAAGTLTYLPASGAVLGAGSQLLQVTFAPSDAANYNATSATTMIVVNKATPVITWANPAAITYGTALSGTQLNASANVAGTFAYAPAAGVVLGAGNRTLSVTFTPSDTANNNSATGSVTLIVNKATPVVTWSNPAGITYGTALSATQLNATANVPGTFAYAPAAGAVLGAATQSLSVTFTPTDSANYNSATGGASIVVARKALTVQTNNASKVYGAALPAFTATGTGFVNGDSMASLSGTLSFSTSATATSAPGTYSVAPSGVSSANYTITFANGTLTVTKASTSVAFTTTPNPSNNNQQVQLRAVVSAVAPGAGTATGTVEFREGSTLLGTATLTNGVATLNKSFKRGTHPLTATYVGDANFNGSSGSVTHQTN